MKFEDGVRAIEAIAVAKMNGLIPAGDATKAALTLLKRMGLL